MSSKEKVFQLELHESLYFHSGDEVEELIHISLDPNVTMEDAGADTILQGGIELQGEYVRIGDREEQLEKLSDLDEIQTERFIDSVTEKDETTGIFQHYFPIEITIPTERLQRKEAVRIEMTAFDYQLPTTNKLEITAIAEIHGIEATNSIAEEKEAGKEREEETVFEFKIEPEVTESESVEEESTQERDQVVDMPTEDEEVSVQTDSEERDFSNEAITEKEANADEALNEITVAEGVKIEEATSADVDYLTDLFREQEEDAFTKMKICIVQEGESIEKIAERFQVSTLELIKKNALDDAFEVSEGQLLYIPRKK